MAPSITTLSIKTLSIKTLSIKTLSIKALSIKTLSIKKLSIKALSIKTLVKLGVHHSYAQIIFPAGLAGQGFSKRLLLFGWLELDAELYK